MFSINFKELVKVLSDDDIQRIHRATLNVLEDSGVRFLCKNAIKIFKEAGFY